MCIRDRKDGVAWTSVYCLFVWPSALRAVYLSSEYRDSRFPSEAVWSPWSTDRRHPLSIEVAAIVGRPCPDCRLSWDRRWTNSRLCGRSPSPRVGKDDIKERRSEFSPSDLWRRRCQGWLHALRVEGVWRPQKWRWVCSLFPNTQEVIHNFIAKLLCTTSCDCLYLWDVLLKSVQPFLPHQTKQTVGTEVGY